MTDSQGHPEEKATDQVLQNLIDLLKVKPVGDDHFLGQSEDLGYRNVFGGQVLGQALMAAYKTISGRTAHSMHAYFLRAGDAALPIDYRVERIRDGGSFSARRVVAMQKDREILTMMASFQVDEAGFDHQFGMPETTHYSLLPSEHQLRMAAIDRIPERLQAQARQIRPIEIRPVDPVDLFQPEQKAPRKQHWFRASGRVDADDTTLHHCLLAYASDFGLLGTSMHPHGVTYYSKGMQVASLDHALWFHRPFRVNEWLLYDMDSPSASGGRGFSRGTIYNEAGKLVASVCQEALIRQRLP